MIDPPTIDPLRVLAPPATNVASRRFGLTVLVATLAAFGLVLALLAWRGEDAPSVLPPSVIDGISSSTTDDDAPPQRDLAGMLSCGAEIGVLRAEGAITNHSTTTADYTVQVIWSDGGVELGRGTTQLQAVRPGRTLMFVASTPGSGNSAMSCRVTRVDRTAAGS